MSTLKRPGWYPAPDRNGEQWWNGVSWSESRRSHRAIPPAASVAYNAQTGHYGTPGTPTAVPGALSGSYQAPGGTPPASGQLMSGQALLAAAFAVGSLFFAVLAVPALFLAFVARRINRRVGGPSAITTLTGIAIGVAIFAVLLYFGRLIDFGASLFV